MAKQFFLFDFGLDEPQEPPRTEVAEPKIEIPTLDEIVKLCDKACYRHSKYEFLSDLFECGAIAISNKVDWRQAEKREERYKQIVSKYNKQELDILTQAFAKIFTLLSSMTLSYGKFDDYLGKLYMMSETSSNKLGQFFTPFDISRMCAKTTIDKTRVEEHKANGKIFSILEPTCGSGGMVLAALDVLWNDCNFNYTDSCFVEASDIDARCVHMCYLQLSLAGVPAIIKKQDALSRQLFDVWYTPAYLFQYLKFREFERVAHI
jgi:type I restriction-modification system DNA methylase subunit